MAVVIIDDGKTRFQVINAALAMKSVCTQMQEKLTPFLALPIGHSRPPIVYLFYMYNTVKKP